MARTRINRWAEKTRRKIVKANEKMVKKHEKARVKIAKGA
jgi:hypothetical protein